VFSPQAKAGKPPLQVRETVPLRFAWLLLRSILFWSVLRTSPRLFSQNPEAAKPPNK
jgi:hypothetical protein